MARSFQLLVPFLTAVLLVSGNPISQENETENSNRVSEGTGRGDVSENSVAKPETDCSKEEKSIECSYSSEENTSIERKAAEQELPENPSDYLQPLAASWPSYQTYDVYPNVQAMGIGFGNYRNVWYPHVHPKLLASYNAGFTVNSLPPVHSTFIHGLIPQEELERSRYDVDMSSPRSYVPTVLRPVRTLRTPEEDLLAQLRHDAIMNNIVPTMSVPFARYAVAAPGHYAPAGSSGTPGSAAVTAVFPTSGTGCAQPVLFSCTPKIIYGSLKPVYPNAALHAAPGYREDAEKSKSAIENHNTPIKVDLVAKEEEQLTKGKQDS